MFKKIQLSLIISCLSASSYAGYVVNSNLSIDNKTDAALTIVIDQPNGQLPITQLLPPHQLSTISMNNAGTWGILYKPSNAPFTIKADGVDGRLLMQGRVAYYIGPSIFNKYSYLDSVSSADSLKVDLSYSCVNNVFDVDKVFENKIVIDGSTSGELQVKDFPEKASCEGLKSSEVINNGEFYNSTCFDGVTKKFWRYFDGEQCSHVGHSCQNVFGYTDGSKNYLVSRTEDQKELQDTLDRDIGKVSCSSW